MKFDCWLIPTRNKKNFSFIERKALQSTCLNAYLKHLQLQIAFWHEETEGLEDIVADADNDMMQISGTLPAIEHRFIRALIICQEDLLQTEANLSLLRDDLAYLTTLSEQCIETFGHKRFLLQAELDRLNGDAMETIMLRYEQAV